MKRGKKYIVSIIILIILEISLIELIPALEFYKHPLLSSLMCVQTEDINDLYWNINQIDLSGDVNSIDDKVKITLTNNVTNFESYLFRTDNEGRWRRITDAEIDLRLKGIKAIIEVKAGNKFGEETVAVTYKIIKKNDRLKVFPEDKKIIKGKYDFRFETYTSPKVNWLRQYTLPVVEDVKNQWEKYIALRRWVRKQIPFKDPVMKTHWDAQRILQAVWSDSTIGFICGAYAATYTSACISVGLNARIMHLENMEGDGHFATEVWSDYWNKWIFMDPLYDCYCTMNGEPLSTLELHNLWKTGGWSKVIKRRGHENTSIDTGIPEKKYFSLFHDIQLISANDFLSNPFTNIIDLLTAKIRYIRWVDEPNLRYNKVSLATKLILFYYIPKISRIFIIPLLIPLLLLVISILLIKEVYKQSSYGRG